MCQLFQATGVAHQSPAREMGKVGKAYDGIKDDSNERWKQNPYDIPLY